MAVVFGGVLGPYPSSFIPSPQTLILNVAGVASVAGGTWLLILGASGCHRNTSTQNQAAPTTVPQAKATTHPTLVYAGRHITCRMFMLFVHICCMRCGVKHKQCRYGFWTRSGGSPVLRASILFGIMILDGGGAWKRLGTVPIILRT